MPKAPHLSFYALSLRALLLGSLLASHPLASVQAAGIAAPRYASQRTPAVELNLDVLSRFQGGYAPPPSQTYMAAPTPAVAVEQGGFPMPPPAVNEPSPLPPMVEARDMPPPPAPPGELPPPMVAARGEPAPLMPLPDMMEPAPAPVPSSPPPPSTSPLAHEPTPPAMLEQPVPHYSPAQVTATQPAYRLSEQPAPGGITRMNVESIFPSRYQRSSSGMMREEAAPIQLPVPPAPTIGGRALVPNTGGYTANGMANSNRPYRRYGSEATMPPQPFIPGPPKLLLPGQVDEVPKPAPRSIPDPEPEAPKAAPKAEIPAPQEKPAKKEPAKEPVEIPSVLEELPLPSDPAVKPVAEPAAKPVKQEAVSLPPAVKEQPPALPGLPAMPPALSDDGAITPDALPKEALPKEKAGKKAKADPIILPESEIDLGPIKADAKKTKPSIDEQFEKDFKPASPEELDLPPLPAGSKPKTEPKKAPPKPSATLPPPLPGGKVSGEELDKLLDSKEAALPPLAFPGSTGTGLPKLDTAKPAAASPPTSELPKIDAAKPASSDATKASAKGIAIPEIDIPELPPMPTRGDDATTAANTSLPAHKLAAIDPTAKAGATAPSAPSGPADLMVTYNAAEQDVPLAAEVDLKDMASVLKQGGKRVHIVAYAGEGDGQAGNARRTSLARAIAVRNFLAKEGVASDHITTQALGSDTGGGNAERVDLFYR